MVLNVREIWKQRERERLLKWTKVKKSNFGNQQQAVAQKLKTP